MITMQAAVSSLNIKEAGEAENLQFMLLEAKRYLVEGDVHAAISTLVSALEQSENDETRAGITRLAGDLYQRTGQYDKAREVYSSSAYFQSFSQKYLLSFVEERNIKGLLHAWQKKTCGEDAAIYVESIRLCLQRLAGEMSVHNAHVKRFFDNVTVLERIDPRFAALMTENGFPKEYWRECLRFGDACYVWHKDEVFVVQDAPPNPQLKASIDAEQQGFIAICRRAEDFLLLSRTLAAKQRGAVIFLCCIVIDYDRLAKIMTVIDLSGLERCGFALRFVDAKNPKARLTELFCVERLYIPWRAIMLAKEDEAVFQNIIVPHLKALEQSMLPSHQRAQEGINAYYHPDFFKTIPEKIESNTLRVMFVTSRHTNFVQFCIRDLANGFRQLGYETYILMEEAYAPTGVRRDVNVGAIQEFKPDIVFQVNHNRNGTCMPKGLPCINWVQDEDSVVFSHEGSERLAKYDLMLFAHPVWRDKLLSFRYPPEQLQHFMIPVNDELFFARELSVEDRQRYGADIVYVANCSATAQEEFEKILSRFGDGFRVVLTQFYEEICQHFAKGESPCTSAEYREMLQATLVAFGVSLHEEGLVKISEYFWHRIGGMLFRQQPLQWLSDAGYNLALYGRGWGRHPTLARHDRGWIENGDAMAKVFTASALNLCVHQTGNYSSRVFDGIASGGFFLMRRHPADFKEGGLGDYFDLEREMVFFDSRDDLLRKVDYYLRHREARQVVIDRAREKILSCYTYRRKLQEMLHSFSLYLYSLAR